MRFDEFGLKPEIVKALAEMGIEEPTGIQEIAIPMIMAGEDVVGMSFTGSGKTLAFSAPLLHHIDKSFGLQVMVLAPTRELAVQIAREMGKFGKHLDIQVATVYGGVPYEPQIEAMHNCQVLVATPGRMLDHLQQRNITLDGIFSVVLDEADKMVEMGFIEDVEEILSYTPHDRQILLFGATLAGEIERIQVEHMYQPQVAKANERVEEDQLKQYFYNVKPYEKFSLLVHLLRTENPKRVMIFASARSTVDLVSANLERNGFKNVLLHGKLSQPTRLKMIQKFNDGEIPILVASPVAARGLDIKEVSHVINYDVSKDPQEYIHRIGRTARAGESGKAITILCDRDHEAFGSVHRRFDVSPVELPVPRFPSIPFRTSETASYERAPERPSRDGDRHGPPRGGSRGPPRGPPRHARSA